MICYAVLITQIIMSALFSASPTLQKCTTRKKAQDSQCSTVVFSAAAPTTLRAVRRAPTPVGAPKNRQLKNHHSYNNYNADIISFRNIRHVYHKTGRTRDIFNCSKKLRWCPPPKTNTHSTSQAVGAIDMEPFLISVALTTFTARHGNLSH